MASAPLSPVYTLSDCRGGSVPPVVLSSPHSGRDYPLDFLETIACAPEDLRRTEDAWMDRIARVAASRFDLPLIAARWGRCFLDLNRAPGELDGALVEGVAHRAQNDRIRAGLGVVPRLAHGGKPLYDGKLALAEATRRIGEVHRPYHAAVARLLARAAAANGHALLIDCHSMPPLRERRYGAAQIVLGDRNGSSAAPDFVDALHGVLSREFVVARNQPYAGGFTTASHGDPASGIHAVQIEIDRSLYMDLGTLQPNAGMTRVAALLADAVGAAMAVEKHEPEFRQAAE